MLHVKPHTILYNLMSRWTLNKSMKMLGKNLVCCLSSWQYRQTPERIKQMCSCSSAQKFRSSSPVWKIRSSLPGRTVLTMNTKTSKTVFGPVNLFKHIYKNKFNNLIPTSIQIFISRTGRVSRSSSLGQKVRSRSGHVHKDSRSGQVQRVSSSS